MANEVREIIGEILAAAPSETAQNLLLYEDWEFDELFAETQHGFPLCKESQHAKAQPNLVRQEGSLLLRGYVV